MGSAERGLAAPADVAVRAARPDDAPTLAALATQVFLDTYAGEGVSASLAREVNAACSAAAFAHAIAASGVRVAERGGSHLVGFAQLRAGAPPDALPGAASAFELVRLYVQRPFAGRGVGSALLRDAERVACRQGAVLLWLTAWEHNTRALAFYARHGFCDHGRTIYTFEDASYGNRWLAKRLTAGDRQIR